MRSPKVTIRERPLSDGIVSFQVDAGVVNGKRQRKQFPSRREAEDFARKTREARRQKGSLAFQLTHTEQVDAADAVELLRPFGTKVTEAVRYYLAHAQPEGGKRTINEVIEEFLAAKRRANKKIRYIEQLGFKLKNFGKSFGERLVSEVTTKDFQEWRDSREFSSQTRVNYHRDLGIFFRFAQSRGYSPRNPVTAAEKVSHTSTPPQILSVAQTVILLGQALSYRDKCDLLPYLAIGLFAGLRSSEIETLQWKDVKPFAERPTLTVQAESSKTRQRRVVTMSPNLKAWLEPYRERLLAGGPVVCSCWREHFQIITKEAGLVWPHNALRHSFGSYHLARHRNVGETAHEMGNSPDMVHRHYKELVQPDAAEQFFSILPPANNSWYWEIFDQTQNRDGERSAKSNPKPQANEIVDQMRELIRRHDATNSNDSLPGRVIRMKSR